MSPLCTEGQNGSASIWQGFCTIGRYTQTRQRRLRGKTVNTGHGRHYKEALAVPCRKDRKTGDFSQRKRKSRVRGKEKRLERKQREKRKEN